MMTLTVYQLRRFANDWLNKTYGISLETPLDINGRLKTTYGRFLYKKFRDGRTEAKAVELNKFFVENNEREVVLDVLKHELVHYALFTLGKPCNDGDPYFEGELKRLNIISQTTVGQHAITNKKITKTTHHYKCRDCGKNHQVKRALKNGGIYHRCKCGGHLKDNGKHAI